MHTKDKKGEWKECQEDECKTLVYSLILLAKKISCFVFMYIVLKMLKNINKKK